MLLFSADELRDLLRKEITDLKRNLNEEIREKEAVQKTAADLRNHVKKLEGEKTELSRQLQEAKNRIGGEMTGLIWTLRLPFWNIWHHNVTLLKNC